MNIPDDLRYTRDHEWTRTENDTMIVGITDHAQGELGDIVFIEFPQVGDQFSKEEPFGTIEAVKTVADLFAPISGEIMEINENLEDSPESVNLDPYGEGWLIKMKPTDSTERDILMNASDYTEYVQNQ